MVVMLGECGDLGLEFVGQAVVLEQDAVLECLELARRATDVIHAVADQPIGKVSRDVAWPVVGQQPRPVTHACLRAA